MDFGTLLRQRILAAIGAGGLSGLVGLSTLALGACSGSTDSSVSSYTGGLGGASNTGGSNASTGGATDAGSIFVPYVDAGECPTMLLRESTDAHACASTASSPSSYDLTTDAGDCPSRTPVPCTDTCAGSQLDEQIGNIVATCQGFRQESSIQIVFSDGCAVQLNGAVSGPNPEQVMSCLTRALTGTRFACAEHVACWFYARSTLA